MDEFTYYALKMLSDKAISKADELGFNPNSHNYKTLNDPRREGWYLYVVVDNADGYILFSQPIKTLDEISEKGVTEYVLVD